MTTTYPMIAAALASVVSAGASGQALKIRYAASPLPFTPLHSYAAGEVGQDVLFFGGVSGQGMHTLVQGGGSVAFPLSVYSDKIHLVDQVAGVRYSGTLSHLSQAVREHLRFVSAGSVQFGDTFYIYGGYGPLDVGDRWTTKASALQIDLLAVRAALRAGQPVPQSAFAILPSTAAQVAGTYIVKLGGTKFALVGGSNFTGDYGLGEQGVDPFTNSYSDSVHFFDSAVSLTVPFKTFTDQYWLHRRDLNALPITMPGGTPGVVLHGGVFNAVAPWEQPATIGLNDTVATIHDTYTQAMNQYEAPHVSLYSASQGANRIVILGGLSYQVWDAGFQQFFYDFLIPWVTTVTDTTYVGGVPQNNSEKVIGDTALPTTNAELVLRPNIPVDDRGQVLLDQLPRNEILLGRVFGGLSAPFPAPDPATFASSNVYDVYLVVGVRGDCNKDGVVNFIDLNIVLSQFGASGAGLAGDLNLDGVVNFTDLNVVLSNFGSTTPG